MTRSAKWLWRTASVCLCLLGVVVVYTPEVHAQSVTSSLRLPKATTPDAASILVTYEVGGPAAIGSFQLSAYRAPDPEALYWDQPIGAKEDVTENNCVEKRNCLGPGVHHYRLAKGVPLEPDARNKFVIVVADTPMGVAATTYFRKYMLAAISHGYNRWAADVGWKNGLLGLIWPVHNLLVDEMPPWEPRMADRLLQSGYDQAIAFDWMDLCAKPERGMAVKAGEQLYGRIVQALSVRREHPGDVVDIHFIGHSRGAVVVSEALKLLKAADSQFGGGYIEMTLLDPHPANNHYEAQWSSVGAAPPAAAPAATAGVALAGIALMFDLPKTAALSGMAGLSAGAVAVGAPEAAYRTAAGFQENASDPRPEIAEGVKRATIWYQHTEANCLKGLAGWDLEYVMNLWGMVDMPAALVDNSRLNVRPIDVGTRCRDAIGHNEVPDLYLNSLP